jgi:hypothetical protein
MPMLVAGLLLLWLSSYLLRGFVRASPQRLARVMRSLGGWLALGFALLTMLRGEFNLAFGAALFGLWLLGAQPGWPGTLFGASARRSPNFGGRTRPRISRVRTMSLEMMLDQASGRMTGRFYRGPGAGRVLDDLSESDCVALRRWCEVADPQGARLLETYLDRRFPAWREAGYAAGDPRTGGARGHQAAGMSEREAHGVLGLAEGATKEEITRAHHRLMMKNHPDHGGSTAMAARINEAKDVLMRRHA